MKNFRAFNSAVEFHRLTERVRLRGHLREQLSRAASSVVLNLAEGRGRRTTKDQARLFRIAFGSVRECQAILILAGLEQSEAWSALDMTAAQIYRLLQEVAG